MQLRFWPPEHAEDPARSAIHPVLEQVRTERTPSLGPSCNPDSMRQSDQVSLWPILSGGAGQRECPTQNAPFTR